MSESEIIELPERQYTIANVKARNMMKTGKVPPEHIKQFPGRGGKLFKYVSHVYLTQALNEAFGQYWSTEMKDPVVYDDGSASITLTLHLDFPGPNGLPVYRRSITEVGAHSVSSGMNKADLLASAASRALYRCCMRAFGIGLEFYPDENFLDGEGTAWALIKDQGTKKGLTSAEIIELVNVKLGITKAQVAERFEEAYKAVNTLAEQKKKGYPSDDDIS